MSGTRKPARGTQHPESRDLEVDDVIVVDKKEMRRAQIGAGVGNFIEWYDFGIYGYLAVIMTKVFTEGIEGGMGLLVTLLGFAVSFLVRPLGGIILGPLGDRIGRQKVLFYTMAMMAVATALIGMLPTAGQVGLWVIIPLYLLKMVQGFSCGGEFSGASTYVAEFSPDKSRGMLTSLLNSGSMLGFAAGAGVVAITTVVSTGLWGDDAMLDGAWRIPFLIALPLGAVAIWFRSRIPETPSFELEEIVEGQERGKVSAPFPRLSMPGVVRTYWREILIGISLTAADSSAAYALTSYMPTYLETEVGVSNIGAAIATIPILVVVAIAIPFIARWSDRIGRKPIYAIAIGSTLVLMVPAFAILQIGEEWAVYIALVMTAIPVAFFLSMTAAVLPALFPTASRFGGMGLTHNIAVSAFGGTAPLFSQALIQATGNTFMPAFYVMFFSAIAIFALVGLKETGGRPLLGSVPTVTSEAEAEELVRGQSTNDKIDTSTMPLRVVP